MPKGIYKRTEYHRTLIRNAVKGKPKLKLRGIKLSEEHKKHLSESHKGQIAWNKGLSNEFTRINAKKAQDALRGKPAWNRGLKMPQITGEKHPAFKGDSVGYSALHDWVYRYKGVPEICQGCGSEKNLQWASIDSKYIRDIDEWISLCSKCHYRYDGLEKKRWKK